jgi:hypothetical protein
MPSNSFRFKEDSEDEGREYFAKPSSTTNQSRKAIGKGVLTFGMNGQKLTERLKAEDQMSLDEEHSPKSDELESEEPTESEDEEPVSDSAFESKKRKRISRSKKVKQPPFKAEVELLAIDETKQTQGSGNGEL